MKNCIIVFILVMTMALCCHGESQAYKRIYLRFGDVRLDNDWGVYINGERLKVNLDEALEAYSHIPILAVEVEGNLGHPLYRGILNSHELFEDPWFADTRKKNEVGGHLFVRAPTTRPAVLKKARQYIKENNIDMTNRYLVSISFFTVEKIGRYEWQLSYRRWNADGGGIYIFYNLLTDEFRHMGVY